MLCMITQKEVLMLLIYCRHLIQLASNANDALGFAFILNTCRSNTKTILQNNRIKMSNFEFTYSIGKALVLPAVRRRYERSNGLHIKIINKMRRFLGIKEVLVRPEPENFIANTGRCFKCVESIVGTAHYKIKQKKMNSKLKTKCSKCLKFICKQHQAKVQFLCADCEK